MGNTYDDQGNTAPMVLMGYIEGEPVYRTTNALATGKPPLLILKF